VKKKEIILIVFLLAAGFIVVSIMKYQSGTKDSDNVSNITTTTDTSRVFWDYYNRATNYRHSGLTDSSIVAYVAALKYRPDHQDALYYLGSMYMRAGKIENAIRAWHRLITVNSKSARTYKQLGDLYFCPESGKFFDPGKAREYLMRAVELNREAMEPLVKLGEVALYQNRLDEASGIFTKIGRTNQKNAEAHFMLGYLSWKAHRISDSDKELALTMEYSDQLHIMTDETGGTAISQKNASMNGSNSCAMFVPWIKKHVSKIKEDDVDRDASKIFSSFDNYVVWLRIHPDRATVLLGCTLI